MADVTYASRVSLEPAKMDDNRMRRVHMPAEEEPILFGAHDEIADYYGVSRDKRMPQPSTTWLQQRAADCWAPSTARWKRVKSPSDSLYADVASEMETENSMLQCKKIGITFHLAAEKTARP